MHADVQIQVGGIVVELLLRVNSLVTFVYTRETAADCWI